MKIAIPLFHEDVSPRFGCTGAFLIASIKGGEIESQERKDVSQLAPRQLGEFLSSEGVEKVICGGVHRRFQVDLEGRGMEVIWGVIGSASDALEALLTGTLRRDQFVCRVGHGCSFGRRRRGRHRK